MTHVDFEVLYSGVVDEELEMFLPRWVCCLWLRCCLLLLVPNWHKRVRTRLNHLLETLHNTQVSGSVAATAHTRTVGGHNSLQNTHWTTQWSVTGHNSHLIRIKPVRLQLL